MSLPTELTPFETPRVSAYYYFMVRRERNARVYTYAAPRLLALADDVRGAAKILRDRMDAGDTRRPLVNLIGWVYTTRRVHAVSVILESEAT